MKLFSILTPLACSQTHSFYKVLMRLDSKLIIKENYLGFKKVKENSLKIMIEVILSSMSDYVFRSIKVLFLVNLLINPRIIGFIKTNLWIQQIILLKLKLINVKLFSWTKGRSTYVKEYLEKLKIMKNNNKFKFAY